MSPKSFQDLIDEVHEKGICQECGGCVSFCSSADYNIIGFKDSYSPPVYTNKDQCLECGICYYICPQTEIQEDELNEVYQFVDFNSTPIGFFQTISSCQTNDKEFLEYGTDGGVVNSILNYLIEKKMIDGAIVSKVAAPFSREAMYAQNRSDLLKASGTKLDLSPQLEEIQKFCTYTSSIPELRHYKFKKLAVVGTPCQIYTMRCMQNLGVSPSENIDICLGLFCYENFFFDRSQMEKFEKDFNIQFKDIKKINIKKDVIIKLKNGNSGERVVNIPFKHLEDYMRPACNACNDFTNIYADLSFGGIGSPDRYTTVIARTEKGKKILNKVLDDKIIKCLDIDNIKKNEIKDLLAHLSSLKIKRKNDFLKSLG